MVDLQVEGDDEADGETSAGIDMSAYILVVESDVPPSTGSCEISSHYYN